MKIKRSLAVLCAAAVLLLCTAGCGASNEADTAAVNAAVEKFRSCGSFSLHQVTSQQETIVMEDMEYECSTVNELHMALITGDDAAMMTSTDIVSELDGDIMEQSAASYVIPEDGGYAEYHFDGAQWVKVYTEQTDVLSGMGPDYVLVNFFAEGMGFKKAGEESLDSGKALRYDGVLQGEELVTMLWLSGALSGVSTMSQNQQTLIRENLIKDLKAVTVSVWVDEASGYPVRFEIDLADTMQQIQDSISKTLGDKESETQWAITDLVITMSLGDFDAVSEIVLPAEAADAALYETTEPAAEE